MCIIIAKEKENRLPSIEELKNCFNNNSDGAGFMYVYNNKVVCDKGYMTLKSFLKHYRKLCKKFNDFENKSLVIHCRIGTSGTNSPENCHPYPVSTNIQDLKKPYKCTNLGLAHNGIISAYNPIYDKQDINDTQKFTTEFLSQLYTNYKNFYKNENILKGIENIIKSKIVLLDTSENITYIGDFINDNGLNFSNTTYKSYNYYNWNYDSYKYDFKNYTETKKEKENKMRIDDLIELKNEWQVVDDFEYYKVGTKKLYFDTNTFDLYEKDIYNNLSLISQNVMIYNEYDEMLF